MDLTNVTTNINPSITNTGSLGISDRIWGNAFIHDLSISSIAVSLNLNPLINNSLSLGAPLKRLNNAYIRDLSVSSIDVSVNINPLTNNRGSLGIIGDMWGNAFLRDLSVSSIDVSVNVNPLTNNSGSLGISNKRWGNAHIRDISATSINLTTNLLPLTNFTGNLGSSTNYWYQICTFRAYISYESAGNSPSDIGGVGLLLDNTSSEANRKAILQVRSGDLAAGPGSGSRAGVALDINGKYGWQISTRSGDVNNALFFNNASAGGGSVNIQFRQNGNVVAPVNFQNNSSDDRLKHNEIIINNGLTIIDQLTPKFYQKTYEMLDARYYGDLSGYTWTYESGLIAQELLQTDISFVVKDGDYYDSNNVFIKQPYNVNYTSIFVYGLAAIKELYTKVKIQDLSIVNLQETLLNQETTLNNLITRIEALENKV
jgi:hypothetical protein